MPKSLRWLILLWIFLLLTGCDMVQTYAVCPCKVTEIEYRGISNADKKPYYTITVEDSTGEPFTFHTHILYNIDDTVNF